MRNLKITKVLLVAIIFIGGLYLILPEYLRNTLIYQYADIDDFKLFDNRTVIAGTPDPWGESPGFSTRTLAPGFESILDEYKTMGFLVVKDEKILFEKYYDGYSSESLSCAFSMSKSIVGLLVGIAIDKGSIKSVDQPVGDFIPEFANGRLKELRIRHLLEMSAGLSWKDSYWNPFSVTAKSYYGDNLRELAVNQELINDPGVSFEYNNGNTQLLAMVLENATGMSVSAYTSQNLWKPMGADRDALWSLDEINGVEKAFVGFNSTARDFARFGQLILNGGSWNGRQLVSRDYLSKSLTPSRHLVDKFGDNVDYYGWQWWIHKHNDMLVYSMRGLKGQYVMAIPDKNMVIVRLGKNTSKERIDNVLPADVPEYIDIALSISGD